MSFDIRNVAEAFPPGEFIREELEGRGWTQEDLAEIIGRQPSIVSGLINGKRAVSPAIAADLAEAFGTTAQLWQNLQSQYDLEIASQKIGKLVERGIQPLQRPDLAEPPSSL